MKSYWIIFLIAIAQFFCTSLWFAGNAVNNELIAYFNLSDHSLALLTSAVQFGFIIGTMSFALLNIADRFSPSQVFFCSALLGALINYAIIFDHNNLISLTVLRFLTGFSLAGIYPIGMKIASDHFKKGLGISLSFLVGALVLGTALPHLIKDRIGDFSWKSVIIVTSTLAIIGGSLIIILIKDGPFHKKSHQLNLRLIGTIFKNKRLKQAAFGYFGHMWELYAFWAFIPVILKAYTNAMADKTITIPFFSFIIIAIGSLGCILGGYLSQYFDIKKVARTALLLSFICCLISPVIFSYAPPVVTIPFLCFWGMVVIADSPLFSTIVAQNALDQNKGTALVIVNCIGFAITIISIACLNQLLAHIPFNYVFLPLAVGPLIGLWPLYKKAAV